MEVAKSGQIMFIPDHIPVFMEIAQPSFPYHIKKYKILDQKAENWLMNADDYL